MKILGICGSPRKKSNSTRMVEEVLRGAEDVGAKIKLVKVADLNLEYCDGCLTCDKTGKCHLKDGGNKINEELAQADGLVIGTPDRFDNVSGHLKNFIDRTNPLTAKERLEGKKAVLVTTGYWHDDASREKALDCLEYFCEAHGVEVIDKVGVYEKSGKPGMIAKERKVLSFCRKTGRKLADVLT
jgi:multimeric flavodoxin WrbA